MTDHPDEGLLHRFATGEAEPDAALAVEQHLDGCQECMAVIGAILESGHEAEQERRIGPFILEQLVGHGAMGAVYRAVDTRLQRVVALKVLRRPEHDDEARLLLEARAQARVVHPHVVTLFEAGVYDRHLILVLQWSDGTTLRQWQTGKPWRAVLGAYLDAGEGLAAAHERGLVHRDFKPDNVLVDHAGAVRVTDFGLATVATAAPGPAAAGTPAYLAPETRQRGISDRRSDQYGFCVALTEALTGNRPGRAPSVPARRVPRAVLQVIERGLAADPSARWPDMTTLVSALRAAQHRSFRRWALASGSAAAAVVVAMVWAHQTAPCRRLEGQLAAVLQQAPTPLESVLTTLAPGLRDTVQQACRAEAPRPCVSDTLASMARLERVAAERPELGVAAARALLRLRDHRRCLTHPPLRRAEPDTAELEQARSATSEAEVLWLARREKHALELSTTAVTLARSGAGQTTMAEGLLVQGRILASLGRPSEAVEVFKEAERAAQIALDDEVRLEAQAAQVMELCRGLGETARCAESLRRAQDTAVDPSEPVAIELLELEAAVMGQQTKNQLAHGRFQRACSTWERLPGYEPELHRCRTSLATNAETIGRLDEALQVASLASAASREQGPSMELLRAVRLEASIALTAGQLSRASELVSEAEALQEGLDARGEHADRLTAVRANLLEQRGELAAAIDVQRRLVDAPASSHQGWLKKQRLQLGLWLVQAGRTPEAAAVLEPLVAAAPAWRVRPDTDTWAAVQARAVLASAGGDLATAAELGDLVLEAKIVLGTSERYLIPALAWQIERLIEAGRVDDAHAHLVRLEAALSSVRGASPQMVALPTLLSARVLALSDPAAARRKVLTLSDSLQRAGVRGRVAREAHGWAVIWGQCEGAAEARSQLEGFKGLMVSRQLMASCGEPALARR